MSVCLCSYTNTHPPAHQHSNTPTHITSGVDFTVINHNNHTGRWLSTFRPTWDAKFPATFVSGR